MFTASRDRWTAHTNSRASHPDDGRRRGRQRFRIMIGAALFVAAPVAALDTAAGTSATTPSAQNIRISGLGGVSCPSVNVCFAIGGLGSFPQGSGVIVDTTDGGSMWKVDFNTGSKKSEVVFYAIDCPTTKVCEVAGIGPGDDGSVFGTTDGGATWRRQPVQLVSEPLLAITCSTSRFCLTGGDDPGTPTNPVYLTTNGGATWKTSTVGNALSQIYSLACLRGSTTICFAGGYDGGVSSDFGPILETTDGGKSWTQVAANPRPANALSCPTNGSCEAASGFQDMSGAMWGTTDAGSIWTRQHLPGASDLVSVSCASAAECVAVTRGNQAWGTEHAGSSWSEHTLPSPVLDLRGISCPTSGTCEGVGETPDSTAVAVRTTDGGVTWSVQSLP